MLPVREWTVARRLAIVVGGTLFILIAIAILATIKVQTIRDALDANEARYTVLQRHAIDFRGSVHDRAISLRDAVIDVQAETQHRAEIQRLMAFYAKAEAGLNRMLQSDAEMPQAVVPLVRQIEAAQARALPLTDLLLAHLTSSQRDAASRLLVDKVRPAYIGWLEAINALINYLEERQHEQNDIALKASRRFALEMWAATAVALTLALLVASWVVHGILLQLGTEPVDLKAIAARIGSGDLATSINLRRVHPDSVLSALCRTQTQLSALVAQVRDASAQIVHNSTHITQSNTELSRRTEMMAANLQQTSASMQQLATGPPASE